MTEFAPESSTSQFHPEEPSLLESSSGWYGISDFDDKRGVILKEWSSQDFANIYVRLRPHLVSYARKILNEESQAEEVVQDAFLYLMTALPELDSELGVLRFLKWKTRLLALDILRARKFRREDSLDLAPELVSETESVDESLLRADDAALVALALSKLAPRHRQVLVEGVLLEKSIESMAQERGITQNAMRQLAFRARKALRLGLIGEVEARGKSLAELTSLAVKRVSRPGAAILSLVAILLVSISQIPQNLGEMAEGTLHSPGGQLASPADATSQDLEIWDFRVLTRDDSIFSLNDGSANGDSGGDSSSQQDPQSFVVLATAAEPRAPGSLQGQEISQQDNSEIALALATASVSFEDGDDLRQTWDYSEDVDGERISIETSFGVSAHLAFSDESENFLQHAFFKINLGRVSLIAVPQSAMSRLEDFGDGGKLFHYAAVDFLVGDFSGELNYESFDASDLWRAGFSVEVLLDSNGNVVDATLNLRSLG